MKLTCSKLGAASVVTVEDRLDAQSGPEFEKACQRLIDEGERLLVVDMGSLHYISSAGLRSCLTVGKRLKDSGGSLRLCRLGGLVQQVFNTAGFASVFPIFDSVEAASK
jgi:anti-anti-sigma factor